MAIDSRQGGKVAKEVRRETSSGARVDPYPYIGLVKNNVDTIRAGRLQVWISDFGGLESDPKSWRTVNYCSPYMGATNTDVHGSKTNSWSESPHTYGMWMTPPDIGTEVLVQFIGGDPEKGYWYGCVNSKISRYMFPGNASSQYPSIENSSDEVKTMYNAAKQDFGDVVAAPVTEFNSNLQDYATSPEFVNIQRPIHEPQYKILVEQGLDRDKYRGTVSSSSQRETPSAVFGITTPGRPLNDPSLDPSFEQKVSAGKLSEADYAVKTRKGGHAFIMDDGDVKDDNRLVRLRSSSGHQIIMNDSCNSLYISNNNGTVWIEFTAEGRLQIFGANGIDVRSQANLNIYTDKITNLHSVGKINIKSDDDFNIECKNFNLTTSENYLCGAQGKYEINTGGGFHVDTGSKISLKASGDTAIEGATIKLNEGGTISVTAPPALITQQLPETTKDSSGVWLQKAQQITTINEFVPCHEPTPRPNARRDPVPPAPKDPSKQPKQQVSNPQNASSTASATNTSINQQNNSTASNNESAVGTPVEAPITEKDIRNQPMSSAPVGALSKEGVTSLFSQISKTASSAMDSVGSALNSVTNTVGSAIGSVATGIGGVVNSAVTGVGKYLHDIPSLIDEGLIKSSVTSIEELNISSNWVQNKCGSLEEYLNNSSLQESAQTSLTTKNYNQLCAYGIINDNNINDHAEVSGWLAVAHGMGIENTVAYANNGVNSEQGNALFQQGKYAATLTPQVSKIMAG